jgi:hypothetical protein
MKTVDLSIEHLNLAELLKLASQENVILKTQEGREFLLAETDDLDAEVSLVRQHEELMRLLARRSLETKTYTVHQARERLGL